MNDWWGYLHTNGRLQTKRFFDRLDIVEALESPFVDGVYGPFKAKNRDHALKILKDRLGGEING